MRKLGSKRTQEYSTKLGLFGLFVTAFVAFASRWGRREKDVKVEPFQFLLLGLASYRLGRLAAFDKVFEPFRKPFTMTVEDEYGAAETTEPKGQGAQRALGELLSCPICAGTWIAAGLVYGMHIFPGPTQVFLTIMGAIGAGEFLNAATEYLQWQGEAARKQCGD